MAEKDLTKKKKAPLIRISKRVSSNKWRSVGMYVGAIVFALLVGAILIAAVGVNPFSFYSKMLTMGTIGNKFAYKNIENFIKTFVPLLLTSLGLSLSFKMRFWNIGGEGQFIVGAITSAALAIAIDDALNPILMIILMALGGGLAAGIYGLFTAVLKVRFGTNETLMTLMLNYIALYLLKFFQTKQGTDFFLDPDSARPIFNQLPENSWMITIGIGKFSLNISLIIALVFAVCVYIYLNKTKHGYEICVVGDSKRTAQYAGMNVNRVILRTMFLSAFIIGVASAFHVSTSHTLSETITGDVGWTGIVVAWLARLNPIGVLITSLLISVLQYGCGQACATYTAVDSNIADLLQGIILFVVLASDFFIRYKVNIDTSYFKRRPKNQPALQTATAESAPVCIDVTDSHVDETGDATAQSDNETVSLAADATAHDVGSDAENGLPSSPKSGETEAPKAQVSETEEKTQADEVPLPSPEENGTKEDGLTEKISPDGESDAENTKKDVPSPEDKTPKNEKPAKKSTSQKPKTAKKTTGKTSAGKSAAKKTASPATAKKTSAGKSEGAKSVSKTKTATGGTTGAKKTAKTSKEGK